MEKIRTLLVDDAVVVRRMLTELLGKDPEVQVVGTARNGLEAIEKLTLRPDIVVLDVEMPELDGLGALKEIRQRYPKLPVVMFSSVTSRAAAATMKALAAGANDYVTKPSTRGAPIEEALPELIAKIKLHVSAARRSADVARATPLRLPVAPKPRLRPEIVVIGASTGGPTALASVLGNTAANLSVPVVIVQHMPSAMFTGAMATSMNALSPLAVEHASAGRALEPGKVLVAPGERHTVLARAQSGVIAKLTLDPPLNGTRPAVDLLFKSAATAYGGAVLGVVLTGMGQDGLVGAEAIVKAGGAVIVQDEQTSIVWGMPGSVAKAGLAASVLPLAQIASEINSRVGTPLQRKHARRS